MSSLKIKQTDKLKENIIYTFFSIIIPSLFILSIDLILRTLFINLVIVPWWTIYISIICNIISARVLIYLAKKHAKAASYIRIHVFIYLPTAALLYFIQQESPMFLIYSIFLFSIQCFILFRIFNKLKNYFEFFGFVNKKSKTIDDPILTKNDLISQHIYSNLNELNSLIKSIHFILFFFVSALIISNVQLSIVTLSVSFSSILSGIAFSHALSVCQDEYNYIVIGFSVTKPMKQQRFTYILLLLLIALILMFLAIQNSRFFSPEDILNFLRWLFPEKEIPRGKSIYFEPFISDRKLLEIIPEEFNTTPLFDLGAVFDMIGMIIGPILIIAFILFIIKPLMEHGIKKIFKGFNPIKALLKSLSLFLYSLKRNIKEIFQNISQLFYRSEKSQKSKSIIRPFGITKKVEKKSYHKKLQTNRVKKMFAKLILWGQKQNILYHPSLAPNEYVNMIIIKNPDYKNSLEKICLIFEEALFSNHIIEGKKIKEYTNNIKEIIK